MASIDVRKGDGGKGAQLAKPETHRDPLRMMRDLMNWDPFREMAPFVAEMPAAFSPTFDVKETQDGFVFKADVPGVKDSDIEVTSTGNRLTIAGKRETEKEEKNETYYSCERSYGSFQRSFTMPEGVDMSSVHADLDKGVLTVSMKKLPEARTQKIAINAGKKS